MPPKSKKISLVYFVVVTLLLVGLVPSVLTGWFLSERSATELRAVENRYQTQLVQEKARQIEMFGQRYGDLVGSYAKALELSNDLSVLSSPQTEEKLGATLKENPNLLALYVKPISGESLSVFRAEIIKKDEIENLSSLALTNLEDKKLVFGQHNTLTFGILVNTVENMANGKTDLDFMPRFDDFSIWDDVVHPFFLSIGVYLVSFGLVLILLVGAM